jgi:hypothetical protein
METITETSPSPAPLPPVLTQTVLVLGMHRSGTSALSRVLNLMGMDLGQDLMPPAPDNNETGFWEHRILQWINQRTFESLGREWDSILPLPDRWWEQPQIEGFRGELREVIRSEFSKSALWGLKDPRISFMLPLWEPLLREMNCEPRCVLIFRNPIEVARSLEKRDLLPASQSYLMWLRNFIEAERGSRGLPRTMMLYESLLSDWKTVVQRIGRDLRIDWPTPIEEAAPAVEEFLRPSLRHHQADNRQLFDDPHIPEPVRRAYGAILAAIESGNVDDLSPAAEAVARELDNSHPMLVQYVADAHRFHSESARKRRLDAKQSEEELSMIRGELTATQTALVGEKAALAAEHQALLTTQAALMEHQSALAATQASLAATQASLAATQASLAGEQAALAAEQTALASERATLERERAINAAHQEHIGQLERHQIELDAELRQTRESLTAQLRQTRDELDQANQSITQKDRQMTSTRAELAGYMEQRMFLLDVTRKVWQTRSWRWTAPLRAIRKSPLTLEQLIPAAIMESLGNNRWRTEGPAHFILPCLPIWGNVRIRLKLRATVGGMVMIFFDTGHFFNDAQHLDLGQFTSELEIDQIHFLSEPVHCFRFDPVQSTGEFEIERFEILPLRSISGASTK